MSDDAAHKTPSGEQGEEVISTGGEVRAQEKPSPSEPLPEPQAREKKPLLYESREAKPPVQEKKGPSHQVRFHPGDRGSLEHLAGIKVVGIGGAGCNAISRMMEVGLKGVEFIAINTDAQSLLLSNASHVIHIGEKITKGLGAGSNPDVGRKAIEQSLDAIRERLEGADMVFLAAGMGGGTGTGAAPMVAELAKKIGALTVGVVTKPFKFEGAYRMRIAEKGIDELKSKVDTLITIPNDKLLSVVQKDISLVNAFRKVDDILRYGVQGISDIIVGTGIVNVDFADVQTILLNAGSSQLGIGIADGPNRAVIAAERAISSPLLDTTIDGATRILFNVTGDPTLSLYEVKEAADIIVGAADPDATIVFGAVVDQDLQDEMKIIVLATGLGTVGSAAERKPEAQEAQAPFKPQVDMDELDIPAILRRRK
ncbi:MAG: cell division protein FtsZ [Candidatus Eremiobacteraeota bacterium]|nr:cell division protein FtsZ [Candidatus Eremiobacteraeota bacterium]